MRKIRFKKDEMVDFDMMSAIIVYSSLIVLIIGLVLIIPAFVGVVLFVIDLFGFETLQGLSRNWTGELFPVAPIFMGIMGLAGGYMIIGAFKTVLLFVKVSSGVNSINEIEITEEKS